MDNTLKGIPLICCRIDDILVSGKNDLEHLRNLREVFHRFEKRGSRCKREKSVFLQDKLVYLGHEVSKSGISPVKGKVQDMLSAKALTDRAQLIAFLGAVNYYKRYLPNISTIIAPLDRLKSSEVKWKWTEKEGVI